MNRSRSTGRVRPGDPGWPSAASWDRLNREVGGRLIKVQSPLSACQAAANSAECDEFFRKLKNQESRGRPILSLNFEL